MTNRKLNLILVCQAALSCLFLLGWTYTLKTNTPAGTDDPTEADDRMRETKAAFVERLDIDHYFTISASSTYDATDTGKHRYVTFREPNDLTSMAADESALFSKDVSSVTELHWIDESDNVLQITSAGYLLGSSIKADSIGSAPFQLENNTYLKGLNAAGDSEINILKIGTDDKVYLDSVAVILKDGSQLYSSAAPTADAQIANKKYVDDQLAAAVPDDDAFGSWASKSNNTSYEAASDGFVLASVGDSTEVKGFTDGNNPPTTLRARGAGDASGITLPVKKGDFWKVTGAATVYWMPVGG